MNMCTPTATVRCRTSMNKGDARHALWGITFITPFLSGSAKKNGVLPASKRRLAIVAQVPQDFLIDLSDGFI